MDARLNPGLAGLLCAVIAGSVSLGGCGVAPAARKPVPVAVAIQEGCNDKLAIAAADLAREKFPDSLPFGEARIDRNDFIAEYRWPLFDRNHDGSLDFNEYLTGEWAGYLSQMPPGQCVISKMDYMRRFLGDPNNPKSGWHVPYEPRVYGNLFADADIGQKGFLTKQDIGVEVRGAFELADRDRDGLISRCELNSKTCDQPLPQL